MDGAVLNAFLLDQVCCMIQDINTTMKTGVHENIRKKERYLRYWSFLKETDCGFPSQS